MDNEQAAQFFREIGEICQKHGIGAFVGWYVCQAGNGDGHFKYYDPTDSNMKSCALIMSAHVENWHNRTIKQADKVTEVSQVITAWPLDQ